MNTLESLNDIFKQVWRSPIRDVPAGVVGCLKCRHAAPWVDYATECSHHKNKRASREWNENHRRLPKGLRP